MSCVGVCDKLKSTNGNKVSTRGGKVDMIRARDGVGCARYLFMSYLRQQTLVLAADQN